MTTDWAAGWHEANQHYLMREVRRVSRGLTARAAQAEPARVDTAAEELDHVAADALDPPPAIATLCEAFALSGFERDLLLLCAGVELDAQVAGIVASLQRPARLVPTFGLALAGLSGAHWSALSPDRPLRRYRLIEVGTGETLVTSPLRVDERILHFLAGVSRPDERLRGLLEPVSLDIEPSPAARAAASEISHAWAGARRKKLPLVQLRTESPRDARSVAAAACAQVGLRLYAVSVLSPPHQPAELDAFIQLCQREAILQPCALFIEPCDGAPVDSARDWAANRLAEQFDGPLITSHRFERRSLRRAIFEIELAQPSVRERQQLWRRSLGAAAEALRDELQVIGSQFDLAPDQIRLACDTALRSRNNEGGLGSVLWDACRAQARSRVSDLVERIATRATWLDLVLPETQMDVLREIAIHVRNRVRVYEDWGFGERSLRGLGISTLFAGPSGTGKTLAAEVLANELRLDLYRIDLSQVVSKYIGETEKNLRRVFDAAERGGGILLFDEADALFGKRSEVKDSHDRYANIEVSYLLQRMEAYRGLAILTTNMQTALDPAFLRRLRFVVEFPFPDVEQRSEIWRRVFPRQAPTEQLDFMQLARMQLAGGNIQNISMCAAFLAAEEDTPVRMEHVRRAARAEYAKLDRAMTAFEAGISP